MQQQLSDIQASINSTQAEIGTLTSEIAQMTAKLDRLNADLTAARGDYRSALQNYEQLQTTSTQSSNSVILTNPAQPPNQSSRNRMLYLMIAVVLGLAMGSGTAFLMENVHAKIRSDQDVRSILQLPVLSTIGKINKKKELVMYSASESTTAEDFRILGNKVRLIHENAMVNIFMITSPVPTEGKSVLVSNLAISLSKMGLQVILVDADLRLPRLHKIFGLNQQNGLTTILNRGSINGTLQNTNTLGLKIVTSGELPENPAELLSMCDVDGLLRQLKGIADLVLIDCPPVLAASDASILASKVDGVLLVLRSGYSESGAAHDAIEALRQVKANLIGVILNSVSSRKSTYSNYYKRK